MSQKPWLENNSDSELDPISSLLSEFSEEDFESNFFFQGQEGRRRKAAFVLAIIWGSTIALHLISWGSWLVLSLTALLGIQTVRVFLAQPLKTSKPITDEDLKDAPYISLIVSAKNEEAVISNLVKMLCNLDYPQDKYELWVINDRSTDRTPLLLDKLATEYNQLKVLHRGESATGGKSGALNHVLPLTKGEILGVFDADARVTKDLLKQVLPLFDKSEVGGVQVTKEIANADFNFWTKGQMTEMALDAYLQQQRTALGGIGEFRGNGQFVRRKALQSCGGWNEQTITDDLDLTIRLHLDNWDILFLDTPAVAEEGVTNFTALWHQRNRWGEGGYQRYLDYWRFIVSNRLNIRKKVDLCFWMFMQYIVPSAAIPDFLMAIIRNRLPILAPLTGLAIAISTFGLFAGISRVSNHKKQTVSQFFVNLFQTLHGALYMFHWMLVIAAITARMSLRPKRLKWVKTVHEGTGQESFEF
ncbi:MAG TPA: glycosyl transferase [Cyanobacteria bacterium UBA11149]|nr:glycosyl transferase [Cyanobacteria bacterium UBA11367]HBE60482.1 glycosyl transferase [Cyanobacteria bacterium UBA11366]HBK62085.1 glycosyl transferase [Cyanobacteria bacterium UBA11166]HBR77184.1 glycosyl transferase [Cyanobacteria bacterium UBA11159]HBW91170.1 glycosyl transferase [Cyanobacteria bacterium UBA11149]HCA93997.1 glycosyl transferase [Cyanobacteria bacterium UBA9226]